MNKNLITWILLLGLTFLSYVFAESSIGNFSVFALLVVAIVKCALVGFQFMKLHKAHLAWRLAFLSVIGIFMLIVSVIVVG